MDWAVLAEKAVSVGVKVIISFAAIIVTFKLINYLGRRLEERLLKVKKADKTLSKALLYICKVGLKVLVMVCIVGFLGIDTSGISAVIASLGVCVGLAVNGTLANLAGGVMLLITRPFKVDDYIEAAGYSGTVEDIHIVNTIVRTPDNKLIHIPNGTLSSSSIINYSTKDTRRVDLTFSIGYGDDFEKAKSIVLDLCTAHSLVLDDPAPFVRVSAHSASSIDIVCRVWTKGGDYWTVYFDLLESVKKAFDEAGIEIPFQQMDVHVKQN